MVIESRCILHGALSKVRKNHFANLILQGDPTIEDNELFKTK